MVEKKLSKADQQVVEDEKEAEKIYQAGINVTESTPFTVETVEAIIVTNYSGMTLAVCARCGKEIGIDDSYEVLPPDYQRVHRPRCEV